MDRGVPGGPLRWVGGAEAERILKLVESATETETDLVRGGEAPSLEITSFEIKSLEGQERVRQYNAKLAKLRAEVSAGVLPKFDLDCYDAELVTCMM